MLTWLVLGGCFVAAGALALVVLSLLRVQPEIEDAVLRLAPPAMREAPVRASVPPVAGTTANGELAVVSFSGDALLAFVDDSSACDGLWRDVTAVSELDGVVDRVVLLTRPGVVARGDVPATVLASDEAWADYGVPGAPYFVHVDNGRVAGEGSATSWAQVARMAREAKADEGLARMSRRRVLSLDFGERLARADRALLDAGIEPGHPSLHPDEVGSS